MEKSQIIMRCQLLWPAETRFVGKDQGGFKMVYDYTTINAATEEDLSDQYLANYLNLSFSHYRG